jgi:hypothetical protein
MHPPPPKLKQKIHQQVQVVGKLSQYLKYCVEIKKTFSLALNTDLNTAL